MGHKLVFYIINMEGGQNFTMAEQPLQLSFADQSGWWTTPLDTQELWQFTVENGFVQNF